MSDDQGDAEFEASLARASETGTAEPDPSGRGDAETMHDIQVTVREVVARVDQLTARLDALPSAEQVDRLVAELRAYLADAFGGLHGDAVMAELAGLRRQLGTDRGTVVEQLQDHLADVASGDVIAGLWDEVREVRDAVDRIGAGDDATGDVLESLATMRAEVEGIGAAFASRAEPTPDPAVAGLREDVRALVDEVRTQREPAGAAEPARSQLDVLADQLASLRDLVTSELDGLRQAVVAATDRTEELARSRDAVSADTPPLDHRVGVDPAVLEELKDEIRAAGTIGDQVADALREELKALRRRIAVKASEKVLDEDQLRQIADAVAERLAKG